MRFISPSFHRVDLLDPDVREALIDELVAVDDQVFCEPTPAAVLAAYRGVEFDACWVMTLRHEGRLVGYNAIRLWIDRELDFGLWRSRAALLPAYRGSAMTPYFATLMYVWFRLRHPGLPLYTLNTLIHPSSFRLFATHARALYPFPKTELSPDDQAIYDRAIELFGLQRVEGCAPFIVEDPTVVETSPQEAARWASSDAPCTRFFLEHNPDYGKGRAVASFLRLSAPVVVDFTLRVMGRKLAKAFRRPPTRQEKRVVSSVRASG